MSRKARILLVEDDKALRETLAYNLEKSGYRVSTAADGIKAMDVAKEEEPDLVLLDLMLPELDGLSVCRALREQRSVPIIMLTARTGEVDKIVGL
ncbi:MAG: response regulator, partial [Anaerolineae bacterium]|nr:response regulator [Anaerolineae bacterium]